jgi:carboxymethylenebutenolidase
MDSLEQGRFDDEHLNSLLPKVPFNRRGFLTGAISAGFAISAGPIMAQTAIRTPADGLDAADVQIPVQGGTMPAYYAAPKGRKALAAVMVDPEVWGLHEYQKDIVRRLAKAGYFGVSYNPYFRSGMDFVKETNIQNILGAVNQLTDTQRLADLDAVVAWLGTRPNVNSKRIGFTGMCMGGRSVWMYVAHSPKVRAGVAWYGNFAVHPTARPKTPIDVADTLHAPVLGLYGGADQGIPLEQVNRMRAALLAFGKEKESQIHVYEGMGHAFHADYRPSYNKAAAEDGWKRMLAWFKKHGV